MKDLFLQAISEDEAVKDTVFAGQYITDCDFSGLELVNVRFERCRFINCDFSYGDFYKCKWSACDFSNCRFLNTHWLECGVYDSKGNGAVFTGSVWKRCVVELTALDYTNFTGSVWEEVSILESRLTKAFLNSMKIKKPIFKQVIFSGTEFFKTKLAGADFSDCAIDGIRVSASMDEVRGIHINPGQAVDLMPLLGIKLL